MRPDERFRTWQVAKTVFFLTIFSALKKYSALAFPRDFCFTPADQWEKFRAKTQAFLLAHQQHVTVLKLRTNQVLTMEDLERLLMESGIVGEEEISRAKSESEGLGLFVRSLVGLDREAAKEAIAGFLSGKTLVANAGWRRRGSDHVSGNAERSVKVAPVTAADSATAFSTFDETDRERSLGGRRLGGDSVRWFTRCDTANEIQSTGVLRRRLWKRQNGEVEEDPKRQGEARGKHGASSAAGFARLDHTDVARGPSTSVDVASGAIEHE